MLKKIPVILFVLFISILFACNTECPCIRGNLYFGLTGFSETEADTIILRRFDKNSNFSVQIDSIPFFGLNFTRFTDTLLLNYFPEAALLSNDYDYELYFPGVPRLIRISEINEIFSEQRCYRPLAREKVDCVNDIISYKLNGQIKQPSSLHEIFLPK